MIKAILLDVDNTLLDFNKCACAAMYDAAREFSLPLPEDAFAAFRRINDGLWRQVEQQTLTTEELYRIRWALIFRELGIDFDGPTFEERFYHYLTTAAEKVDGADELMAYLKDKYILCIASNAPYRQQVQRMEKAGYLPYLHHLFISEEIGAAKPAPRFFEACLAALAPLRPEEVLMIGDSLTADIAGAKACGIRTCWYRHGSGKDGSMADYCVADLREICGIA